MRIAFCTTCSNRRWQLEETLSTNLAVLRGTPHLLALCDFNSPDGLPEFVREFSADVRAGQLTYFRTEEPRAFHASVAKNTAHRLALRRDPDVLFNLDADNFLTPETIALVEGLFTGAPDTVLHHWSGDWLDGTFGRIAVSADSWRRLGGYDETFLGMGWQDFDLLFRARAAGLTYALRAEGLRRPVQNLVADKVANIEIPPESLSDDPARTFRRLVDANFVRSMSRPIPLDPAAQHPLPGRLDFRQDLVI